MEKKLTNSGPLRESVDKHSIYTLEQDLRFTKRVTYEAWQRSLIGQLCYVPVVPLRDQL